jgi:peptidylprolyl isomerase
MANAKSGDTVKVHYTGKLEDGSIFDSSDGKDPLEFTLGEGNIIPGFEAAVLGMEVGDKKTEAITSDNAYGPYQDNLLQEVECAMIPDDIDLEVGKHLQVTRPDAPPLVLTIIEFDDEKVILDANHPLAGKDLIFEIELMEILE